MRKPVYAICEQQRRRSACVSVQSDQCLFVRCLDSIIIPLLDIDKISSLQLVSVADQAGLSLPWSETRKTGFLMTGLLLCVNSKCFTVDIKTAQTHLSLCCLKHSVKYHLQMGWLVYGSSN